MRRPAFPLLAPLLCLLSTAACTEQADPDRAVAAGGLFVPGWQARFDDPAATSQDVRFAAAPDDDGYEATIGPNVVLWHPQALAEGSYRLKARVTHVDSHEHPHGAGLLFGGLDLAGNDQRYTYFLVRGDGQFLVKLRSGADTADLAPWTAHPAIRAEDPEGIASNELAVEVGASDTRFLVNGQEVFRCPTVRIPTDGNYGFRAVHDLDLRLGPIHRENL